VLVSTNRRSGELLAGDGRRDIRKSCAGSQQRATTAPQRRTGKLQGVTQLLLKKSERRQRRTGKQHGVTQLLLKKSERRQRRTGKQHGVTQLLLKKSERWQRKRTCQQKILVMVPLTKRGPRRVSAAGGRTGEAAAAAWGLTSRRQTREGGSDEWAEEAHARERMAWEAGG
jgi:hypothetical protein